LKFFLLKSQNEIQYNSGFFVCFFLRSYAYGYLMLIICISGFLGNVMALTVLSRRSMRSSNTATYLRCLAAVDAIVLLLAVFRLPWLQDLFSSIFLFFYRYDVSWVALGRVARAVCWRAEGRWIDTPSSGSESTVRSGSLLTKFPLQEVAVRERPLCLAVCCVTRLIK
jgi:hypothetical protein